MDGDEDETWDDWVLVDDGPRKPKEEFSAVEQSDRIARETITMKSSKATCLLVSPKN
jgi:serine/threonine protein kinase